MTDGKWWLYIYHHPGQFFAATIALIVLLVIMLAYLLHTTTSETDLEVEATLQALQTQVAHDR